MSRFYDVLKEASRQQPSVRDLEGAVEKVACPPVIESPHPAAEDYLASRPPAETAPAPVHEVQDSWLEAPRNGAVAAVHASPDRRARILPHAADSAVVEHYRRLRTKLLQEKEARPFRLLMIGSPNPQEGKSVTAINLALSFAMLPSYKVLIVDGDLRKGSLGRWLAVEGLPGLSDLIEGTATMREVVQKCSEFPVHFVLAGNSKVPAAELLNSPNLKDSFRQMADEFDLVLVDSPPLDLVTDGQLLAACCDATLLVARAFSTTRKAFEKATQDLQQVRIVGTVLNGGTSVQHYRRYGHYY